MATIKKVRNRDGSYSYRVRVVVGRRTNGSAIQEMRTFSTRREAEVEGAKWEADVARGTNTSGAKITVGEYLNEWLERSARRVRPITLASYRYLVQHCITPTPLAAVRLSKLTPTAVQRWVDALPYAATARKARAVLNIALNEATRLGMLAINPVSRTTPPAHTPRQGSAWTADETRRFLTLAQRDLYTPFWHIAAYLGMRPSEIGGLQWDTVELEAGTLRVARARPTVNGKMFDSDKTKSPSGVRTLALPPALVSVLREHRIRQKERRLLLGERWHEHGLVCTSELGTPLDHRAVQRRFHRLREQAGLERIRVYDLRHTATSLMLDAGADLKAASEALGHSDPRITMKVYRHVRADQRAQAINLLAGALDVPGEPQQPLP
jgi:integrase